MDTAEVLPTDQPRRGVAVPTAAMLLLFYVIFAVNAASDVLAHSAGVRFLLTVLGALNLGIWAVLDAKRRGRPIPLTAQPWFVLLAGVVVPGYVIYSRKLRGLGWVALHFVGGYVTYYAAFALTAAIAYGPDALGSIQWF